MLVATGNAQKRNLLAIEIYVIASHAPASGDHLEVIVVPIVRNASTVVLFHAVIVSVVAVDVSSHGIHAVLSIKLQSVRTIPGQITSTVVGEPARIDVIVGIGRYLQILRCALCWILLEKVSPVVINVGIPPSSRVVGSSTCKAIQLIVAVLCASRVVAIVLDL